MTTPNTAGPIRLERAGRAAPTYGLESLAWGAALAYGPSLYLGAAPRNISLVVAAAALLLSRLGRGTLAWDGLCWGLVAWVSTRLLSAALSATPGWSLSHASSDLKVLCAYLVFLNLTSSLRRARLAATTVMVPTMLALLLALADHAGFTELRLLPIGWGNNVGMYLALSLTLPASLLSAHVKYDWLKYLAGAALLLFVGGVAFTLFRAAMLAVLIFFAWLAWREGHGLSRRHAALALTGLAAALVLAFFFFPAIQNKLHHPLQSAIDSATVRFTIWRAAWRIFLAHPWFGCGSCNYGSFSRLADPYASLHAHNIFLQALAETGLVGLAGLSAFLLTALGALRRTGAVLAAGEARAYWTAAAGALMIMLFVGLMDMPLHGEHTLLLVCLLAIACGLARAEARGPRRQAHPQAAFFLSGGRLKC